MMAQDGSETDGWIETPTPCPECGAESAGDGKNLTSAVLVREVVLSAGDGEADTAWEYRCKACGASGPAHPRQPAE